ncbi:hypothetical protein B0T19DRAFT_109201 [Cercophora scortea]|uniref:BHLH domain-containing protein n=1 Tax=Cercophora scortea TaxID=314031 RepID=A0AAE0IWP2_9PEZI|nr:hypothetical protein B0T19DRAFT_109201 [Cercophora scortea]
MDSAPPSAWDGYINNGWEDVASLEKSESNGFTTPWGDPWFHHAGASGFDSNNMNMNDGFVHYHHTHGSGSGSGSSLPPGFAMPPQLHTTSASYGVPFSTLTPSSDSSSVTWTEAGTPQCISPQGSARDGVAQSSICLSPSSFAHQAPTIAPAPSVTAASESSRTFPSYFPDPPSRNPNPMATLPKSPPGISSSNAAKGKSSSSSSSRRKPAAPTAAAKGKQPLAATMKPPAPSASPTLEEYKDNLRQWHNRIGKKYRNKLNDKFESLHAILLRIESRANYGGGERDGFVGGGGGDDDGGGVSPAGRTARVINKSNVLDMARRRIELLQVERERLRAEKEALLEQLNA